jgi:hypothetical protein
LRDLAVVPLSMAEERPGRVTGDERRQRPERDQWCRRFLSRRRSGHLHRWIDTRSIDRGLGMHHTMGEGTYDHFLDASAHVTAAHARLTPRNAAIEIDRLILTAWRKASSVRAPNDTMILVESIMKWLLIAIATA